MTHVVLPLTCNSANICLLSIIPFALTLVRAWRSTAWRKCKAPIVGLFSHARSHCPNWHDGMAISSTPHSLHVLGITHLYTVHCTWSKLVVACLYSPGSCCSPSIDSEVWIPDLIHCCHLWLPKSWVCQDWMNFPVSSWRHLISCVPSQRNSQLSVQLWIAPKASLSLAASATRFPPPTSSLTRSR